MILMFHGRVFDPDGGFKAFDGPGQSGCHQTIIFKAFECYGYTNIGQTIVFIAFERRRVTKPLCLKRLNAMAIRILFKPLFL